MRVTGFRVLGFRGTGGRVWVLGCRASRLYEECPLFAAQPQNLDTARERNNIPYLVGGGGFLSK